MDGIWNPDDWPELELGWNWESQRVEIQNPEGGIRNPIPLWIP